MIRSEELVDELVATLHFHNYLQMESSNIFEGGPLNVVANNHRKENIQNYIDDLLIDLFFRTHSFKPIIIPKGFKIQRITKDGIINTEGDFELSLNNPYDRYTFLDCLSASMIGGSGYLHKVFPRNSFVSDSMIVSRKFNPVCESISFVFGMPYGDELEQYLNYLYGMKHSKFHPLFRAQEVVNYSKLYQTEFHQYCYKGLTSNGFLNISRRQSAYRAIRHEKIFGEYTIEDLLMIYCLLVEKYKLEEYNFLTFVGLFVCENERENSILNEFKMFEYKTTDAKCIKPFIRERDLFLRFTSATKSKAVKFTYDGKGMAVLKFFNDKPIKMVATNNTLPLPFLYNDLYH